MTQNKLANKLTNIFTSYNNFELNIYNPDILQIDNFRALVNNFVDFIQKNFYKKEFLEAIQLNKEYIDKYGLWIAILYRNASAIIDEKNKKIRIQATDLNLEYQTCIINPNKIILYTLEQIKHSLNKKWYLNSIFIPPSFGINSSVENTVILGAYPSKFTNIFYVKELLKDIKNKNLDDLINAYIFCSNIYNSKREIILSGISDFLFDNFKSNIVTNNFIREFFCRSRWESLNSESFNKADHPSSLMLMFISYKKLFPFIEELLNKKYHIIALLLLGTYCFLHKSFKSDDYNEDIIKEFILKNKNKLFESINEDKFLNEEAEENIREYFYGNGERYNFCFLSVLLKIINSIVPKIDLNKLAENQNNIIYRYLIINNLDNLNTENRQNLLKIYCKEGYSFGDSLYKRSKFSFEDQEYILNNIDPSFKKYIIKDFAKNKNTSIRQQRYFGMLNKSN